MVQHGVDDVTFRVGLFAQLCVREPAQQVQAVVGLRTRLAQGRVVAGRRGAERPVVGAVARSVLR